MTHTKGPWLGFYNDENLIVQTGEGLKQLTESDYNLMLAAPDLLSALELILSYDYQQMGADIARKAIAKAKSCPR
jgi:hypothetical protein